MDRIVVHGGARLEGTVTVSGSKNSTLALMASALLAEGERSQRYIDYLDAATTQRNARDVVTDITPEDRKSTRLNSSH